MIPDNLDLGAVQDILSTLSDEDVENLSAMAFQLFSNTSGEGSKSENSSDSSQHTEEHRSFPFTGEIPLDADTVMRLFSLINKLKNQPEDDRVRLLYALKPMLSPNRRHKVEQAAQIIKLLSLLTLLNE